MILYVEPNCGILFLRRLPRRRGGVPPPEGIGGWDTQRWVYLEELKAEQRLELIQKDDDEILEILIQAILQDLI